MSGISMEVSRSVDIARPIREVFDFVADPANDPRWCKKVLSVQQVEGEGPGPGARYAVVHRPVPLRPPRRMDYACTGWEPPARLRWHEDDGTDVLDVTYELAEVPDGTRLTQRSIVRSGAPRLLHPFIRAGIRHDVGRQLGALRKLLEAERTG